MVVNLWPSPDICSQLYLQYILTCYRHKEKFIQSLYVATVLWKHYMQQQFKNNSVDQETITQMENKVAVDPCKNLCKSC